MSVTDKKVFNNEGEREDQLVCVIVGLSLTHDKVD